MTTVELLPDVGNPTVTSARILVVEDERIVAMSLRKQLQALGYEVVGVTSSGEVAVSQAGELRPDLVLMDIRLEDEIDGVQAAALIREQFRIPVVYLTAYSNQDVLDRAKVTEPFGYILKPYEERELHVAVEMALYKHQMERRLDEANTRLLKQSTTDELTGLKNRRAFGERLAEEVRRAVRYSIPLSLLILDVDHFKSCNDTFGHLAGDAILKQLARILEKTARSTDFLARHGDRDFGLPPHGNDNVGRYGGEEFTIILPNTGREGAMIAAERIRRAVAEGPWQKKPITVSIGVSTLHPDINNSESLLGEADAALYHCKATGRNRAFHSADLTQPQD